jgi:hypothetical protein
LLGEADPVWFVHTGYRIERSDRSSTFFRPIDEQNVPGDGSGLPDTSSRVTFRASAVSISCNPDSITP